MKKIIVLLFLCFVTLSTSAQANLEVDITRGSVSALPIAVQDFEGETIDQIKLGADIAEIVRSNLKKSGLFETIEPSRFPRDLDGETADNPLLPLWKNVGADALVKGIISKNEQGKTRVEFRLWDVIGGRQMSGLAYTTTPKNWRRIAHIMSDEIYKRITGENGYFDSRIVYVAETGPTIKRVKRLAIMDQDGANHQYLTSGSELVLTPRFSPNSQTITYLSYYKNTPRVYVYELSTGRQKVLGDFRGMTFAPRFSPDGEKIIMSLSLNGSSDIYTLDIDSGRKQQLTSHPAIDTSPSYSPDGKRIAFESDRSGTQQIYVMDGDGRNVRRITFGQGRYANPVWSPRGDLIAFTRMQGGLFYIGVIKPDGTGERLIAQAYHIEGPTWSPNGRVISYFKEKTGRDGQKTSKVYTIDLTGYNEQVIKTPVDGSDPAWSPLHE